MIEITLFFIFVMVVLLKPTVIPYMALILLFIVGLTHPGILDEYKVTLGAVNVFPMDLLYLLAGIYFLVYWVRISLDAEFKKNNSAETKAASLLMLFYILFFVGKLINGFFAGLPFDSLIRVFMGDTHMLYFFMPLVIYKDISKLKRLIYFAVILALIFPMCQPFLVHTEFTRSVMKGMGGVLRLGYGDANALLGLGAVALFSWEYKKYLAFLPMAGIMMLAHRSAFVAIAIAFMAISYLRGKNIKMAAMMAVVGVLMIGMLSLLQSFTNIDILGKNLSRAEQTFENTGTTKARIGVIPIIFEEFLERPLTGLEYREFHEMTQHNTARNFNITHPHNFILSTIVNTGLIGVIFRFLLIGKALSAAYKLAKSEQFKSIGIFLFSWMLYFIFYAAMNTTMESVGYMFWFVCGVTFWFFNQYKKTPLVTA